MRLGKAFFPDHIPFHPSSSSIMGRFEATDRTLRFATDLCTEHNPHVHTCTDYPLPFARIVNSPYFFLFLPICPLPRPSGDGGRKGALPYQIRYLPPLQSAGELNVRIKISLFSILSRLSAEKNHTYGPGTGIGGEGESNAACFLNGYLSAREEGKGKQRWFLRI